MAGSIKFGSAVFGSLLLASHAWVATSDGPSPGPLAVVVHRSSKVTNISLSDLRKIFTGDLRVWPDSSPVFVIEQPSENLSQRRSLQLLLRITPAIYNRQLLQAHFQGKPLPEMKVLNSDTSAINFVFNVPGAISIVDSAVAALNQSQIRLLRVDGKLPSEKGYPLQ
ncbi:MAG TPA: hypothetical protein VGL72_30665 [Bryobacteraceae bacterium]|jgi:hypothetical protein